MTFLTTTRALMVLNVLLILAATTFFVAGAGAETRTAKMDDSGVGLLILTLVRGY